MGKKPSRVSRLPLRTTNLETPEERAAKKLKTAEERKADALERIAAALEDIIMHDGALERIACALERWDEREARR